MTFSFLRGNHWSLLFGSILLLGLPLSQSLFTVQEGEQALVIQLGEPMRTITDPGLHWKIPLIQSVRFYEKRLMDFDARPEEVIASDQRRIVVDTYICFRIANPLLFFQTVGSEEMAQTRLQTLTSSALRRVLGGHRLMDLLSSERGDIMQSILNEVNKEAKPLGIDVVDVRIRRADLPKENSEAIYLRMESDRKREAKEFRAQGEEMARKIRATADRDRTVLLAEAEKQAQILRGEGDGESMKIFAPLSDHPQFYEFFRTLQAYQAVLTPETTTFVLNPKGKFFKYFQ